MDEWTRNRNREVAAMFEADAQAELARLRERVRELEILAHEAYAKGREDGRNDALEEALRVPDVWSEEEREGMSRTYYEAGIKHGHYETLFAVVAWFLRHRRQALENPDE